MPTPSQAALLRTLAFFAIFDRVLSVAELRALAWGEVPDPEAALAGLVEAGIMRRRGDLVLLAGGKDLEEGIALMHERAVLAFPMLGRAARFAGLAAHLPFVRGVFLVNSLALGTGSAASDIDLLIVAAPGHIWAVRAATTILAQVLGWRRHGTRIARRLCLSFYLSEDALDLSALRLPGDDPYLLFWAATVLHLAGPVDRAAFLRANAWVGAALPQLPQTAPSVQARRPTLERLLCASRLDALVESMLRRIQKPRMERAAAVLPDAGGSVHSEEMLKFHDRDRRAEFRTAWAERLRTIPVY